MRKRNLNKLSPAKYYLLPHLIEPVQRLCRAYDDMHGGEAHLSLNAHLVEMLPGSSVVVCEIKRTSAYKFIYYRIFSYVFCILD